MRQLSRDTVVYNSVGTGLGKIDVVEPKGGGKKRRERQKKRKYDDLASERATKASKRVDVLASERATEASEGRDVLASERATEAPKVVSLASERATKEILQKATDESQKEWTDDEVDKLVDILNGRGVGERTLNEEEEERIINRVLDKVDVRWRDQLLARMLKAKK